MKQHRFLIFGFSLCIFLGFIGVRGISKSSPELGAFALDIFLMLITKNHSDKNSPQ